MLPATIAQDIRQQVLHYLEATFNFRRHDEEDALRRFISDPERSFSEKTLGGNDLDKTGDGLKPFQPQLRESPDFVRLILRKTD